MTSTELKHQARLQEWAGAIQDCRSSGLSVRQWCRERGTTPTTYYRWERELLSIAGSTKALSESNRQISTAERTACKRQLSCPASAGQIAPA